MLPCQTCAYRAEIPGDYHISCRFNWLLSKDSMPHNTSRNPRRTNRWFRFPFNYDPVWGPDACAAYNTSSDPKWMMSEDPLFDLLSLLK